MDGFGDLTGRNPLLNSRSVSDALKELSLRPYDFDDNYAQLLLSKQSTEVHAIDQVNRRGAVTYRLALRILGEPAGRDEQTLVCTTRSVPAKRDLTTEAFAEGGALKARGLTKSPALKAAAKSL